VLRKTRYNKAKAAKLLQINRTTLYYKMAKYNIKG
jgi:transcriptional regulator with PAS, ATPase and Fis domain